MAQQEKETRRLQRPGSARLFPLPGRGHKYAVEIRGQLNGSAGPGHSELTLLWGPTLTSIHDHRKNHSLD